MKKYLPLIACCLFSCANPITLKEYKDGNFALQNSDYSVEMTKRGEIYFLRNSGMGTLLSESLSDQIAVNDKELEARSISTTDIDALFITSSNKLIQYRRSFSFDPEKGKLLINYNFKNRKSQEALKLDWALTIPKGVKVRKEGQSWILEIAYKKIASIKSSQKLIYQNNRLAHIEGYKLKLKERCSWSVEIEVGHQK